MHLLLPLLLLFIPINHALVTNPEFEKKLEQDLMKGYSNKVRPVKKAETITKVRVFLNIGHIEKIDEHEQTMLVHGNIWATWLDEYLNWNSTAYGNVTKMQIPAWRVWQPAFALYNSARGNSWHLYMNGMPAVVYNSGKVWASGTFSFFVTCQFDFSNWPFDSQKCPIVIADWVYSLAQVNLSDPEAFQEYQKPSIRLNFDPIDSKRKKHIGGWKIVDTWKKHCYWGPRGCKEEQPEGELDWYWSLLEFGVVIQRHVPYFGAAILIPFTITTLLLLLSFWMENFTVNISILIFNLLLQGLYGWSIIESMPPGSGTVPKFVQLYTLNLCLTGFTIVIFVISKFMEDNLPKNYEMALGFDITQIPKKLKIAKLFESKGLSFDPQEMFKESEEPFDFDSFGILGIGRTSESPSNTSIGMSDVLMEQGGEEDGDGDNEPTTDTEVLIPVNLPEPLPDAIEHPSVPVPVIESLDSMQSKLQIQLNYIRRTVFLIYMTIYVVSIFLVFFM